jgi:hypothetical protein
MKAYCLEVCKLENKFHGLVFHHIVCDNNVTVDVLSKLGSTHAQLSSGVFVHELHTPFNQKQAPNTTNPGPSQPSPEVMMVDVD